MAKKREVLVLMFRLISRQAACSQGLCTTYGSLVHAASHFASQEFSLNKKIIVVTLVALAILVLLSLFQELLLIVTPGASHLTTLTVNGKQWGQSSCYIGAVEGSSRFNIADVKDLGINTYRIYGGMPRWEPQDDDGSYGRPTVDEIKANPDIINWAWWDHIMTHPPQGSDYWWDPKLPRWQGSASTLFSSLQQLHIRTVIVLRNQDDLYQPSWAPNPPTTSADWNEWWEHVFALVYWLNVRNHYAINDFEVHNEPNDYKQGWLGNESQYFTFAQYTHDAIDYVYRTYLPGQTYHVYAPSTDPSGSASAWPDHALQSISNAFDSVSIHDYDTNTALYIEQVHSWMDAAGHANYPLWLTEWGSYTNTKAYDSTSFNIHLLTNLIYQSHPGKDYVYGSHIFLLYDFHTTYTGLIAYNGERRAAYYAMRMGIRALQGCRPTYQTTASNETLQAITTMDTTKNIYLLITNQDPTHGYDVDADLSALRHSGDAILWQFDATHMDTIVDNPILSNGHVVFPMPANSSILIKISP
jgi:hypothetical protein